MAPCELFHEAPPPEALKETTAAQQHAVWLPLAPVSSTAAVRSEDRVCMHPTLAQVPCTHVCVVTIQAGGNCSLPILTLFQCRPGGCYLPQQQREAHAAGASLVASWLPIASKVLQQAWPIAAPGCVRRGITCITCSETAKASSPSKQSGVWFVRVAYRGPFAHWPLGETASCNLGRHSTL